MAKKPVSAGAAGSKKTVRTVPLSMRGTLLHFRAIIEQGRVREFLAAYEARPEFLRSREFRATRDLIAFTRGFIATPVDKAGNEVVVESRPAVTEDFVAELRAAAAGQAVAEKAPATLAPAAAKKSGKKPTPIDFC